MYSGVGVGSVIKRPVKSVTDDLAPVEDDTCH